MGIETVLDLLEHYPRRYVDRTERAEIHELEIGQEATVDAEVRAVHARRTRDRKRTIVNATVYDGTGLLEIVFFNQAWRERQLRPGTQVSLFGKVEQLPGQAPDDEPGRRRARRSRRRLRRHRHHRARLPAVGEGRGAHLAAPPGGGVVPGAHEGAGLRRSARRRPPRRAPADRPGERVPRHPPPGDHDRAVGRGAAPQVRRVPAHAARARRAQARARGGGDRHRARGRRPARAGVPRRAAVPAHRRPDRRHRADHRRHGRARRRCTGSCRARSGRARPSSRSPRCSSRCRAATRARSWRRPRCSPNSTSSRCARCSASCRWSTRAPCSANGR